MDRHAAELVMILLGVTAAVLLVAYGLVAQGGAAVTDPVFWILAVAFLAYIGWDVWRHVRSMRSRSESLEDRSR